MTGGRTATEILYLPADEERGNLQRVTFPNSGVTILIYVSRRSVPPRFPRWSD